MTRPAVRQHQKLATPLRLLVDRINRSYNHPDSHFAGVQYQPTVTVCTITHNRQRFLPLLKQNIESQSYPAELIQWVIVDDSREAAPVPSVPGLGLGVTCHRLSSKLPIGRKRNLSHELCLSLIHI